MSFKCKSYLYLAQELAGKTPDATFGEDIRLRSAISRAYYAAFCEAKEYLENKTPLIIPRTISVHQFIKDEFLLSRDGKWRRIGRALELLHEDRKKADYGDTLPNLPQLTDLALDRANNVIMWIGQLA